MERLKKVVALLLWRVFSAEDRNESLRLRRINSVVYHDFIVKSRYVSFITELLSSSSWVPLWIKETLHQK